MPTELADRVVGNIRIITGPRHHQAGRDRHEERRNLRHQSVADRQHAEDLGRFGHGHSVLKDSDREPANDVDGRDDESGHGIAWSPDEEWVAEATEYGIYVWRADDEIPDLVRIPVVARDLLWTGPSGGADAVAEARAALQAAGVPRGRLVYADGDCRNHTLELPGLVASPAGYEGLCRYRAVAGGLVDTQGPPRSPNGRVTADRITINGAGVLNTTP